VVAETIAPAIIEPAQVTRLTCLAEFLLFESQALLPSRSKMPDSSAEIAICGEIWCLAVGSAGGGAVYF